MGRRAKPTSPKTEASELLGRNITRLLPGAVRGHSHTERLRVLHLRCGVGIETLRLMARGESNPDLSKIQAVAVALRVTVADLFSDAIGARNAPFTGEDEPPKDGLQRRRS